MVVMGISAKGETDFENMDGSTCIISLETEAGRKGGGKIAGLIYTVRRVLRTSAMSALDLMQLSSARSSVHVRILGWMF